MPWPEIFVAIVIPFAAIMAIVVIRIRRRHRREGLERAAADLEMTYVRSPGRSLADGTAIGRRGRRRRSSHAIRGTLEDLEVEIFDHSYVTGGGQHTQRHHQTVVRLSGSTVTLPAFVLSPESFMQRVIEKLGFADDIDFDEDPAFSDRFRLEAESTDVEAVRDLFDAELRERCMSLPKDLWVEARGNAVIVYRHRRRIRPDQVMERLTEAFDVASLLWAAARR